MPNPLVPPSIARILPSEVIVEEKFGELSGTLFDSEARLVNKAVATRRNEFAAGRTCARRAMNRLNISDRPVLQGEGHEPKWPDGILGSITHCDGYCAAAICRIGNIIGLGIDAEIDAPLPDGVLELVAREQEIKEIAQLSHGMNLDRLFFSAKEAVYKAWYPLTKCWLDFKDVELAIRKGVFEASIETEESRAIQNSFRLVGRYYFATPFILTSVILQPIPP